MLVNHTISTEKAFCITCTLLAVRATRYATRTAHSAVRDTQPVVRTTRRGIRNSYSVVRCMRRAMRDLRHTTRDSGAGHSTNWTCGYVVPVWYVGPPSCVVCATCVY